MAIQIIGPFLAAVLSVLLGSVETTATDYQDKPKTKTSVTFQENIAPLLKQNCTPCHFEGGKVFGKLPFDQYTTVKNLGKKLNTRLKGDNADLVTWWVEQGSPNFPEKQKLDR